MGKNLFQCKDTINSQKNTLKSINLQKKLYLCTQRVQKSHIAFFLDMATSTKMEQNTRRSIILPNNVQVVPRLSTFVEAVCEASDLDMSTTMKLNLAIEEAVVNVMNYAYPEGTTGTVTIEAESGDEWLTFVISDSGKPFDPTHMEEIDTTLPMEKRSIGGLGIHLVRQIMDTITYERIDGTNVLTLRKKL